MKTSKFPSLGEAAQVFRGSIRKWGGLAAVMLAVAPTGWTQAGPQKLQTVDGVVVNAQDAPLSGAVVYLENPQTLSIRSYLTDTAGKFHFTQITPQTDYDVWAEQNGIQSRHKFISQFSNHRQFHFTLKVQPRRKKFLGIF